MVCQWSGCCNVLAPMQLLSFKYSACVGFNHRRRLGAVASAPNDYFQQEGVQSAPPREVRSKTLCHDRVGHRLLVHEVNELDVVQTEVLNEARSDPQPASHSLGRALVVHL